jgi:hypothetical protein
MSGLRGLFAGITVLTVVPLLGSGKPKPEPPKLVVQLYAQTVLSNTYGSLVRVYLGLPDGSRGTGTCSSYMGKPTCTVDAFVPEKRVIQDCVDSKHTTQAICITNESYYATRIGNDLTLYAANGPITYHLTGSWDSFEAGRLPLPPEKPKFDPNWTAVCQDGTFSYSQQRSGTCSDHGGVQVWRP